MLIDSHCHLNLLEDPEAALTAGRTAGLEGFLCIGVDQGGIGRVLELATRHPDVWATVGQHPDVNSDDLDWIEQHANHPRVVALGEMGLDYFHEATDAGRARQQDRFARQLAMAARYDLPVVIHSRQAEADTIALLRSQPDVIGVLHCFTESWTLARAALDLGYYVSFSGIVTFRNGDNVRAVARQVPDYRLLVETDCPWLAPVPHRGRTNEPAFVTATAAFLAELRGTDAAALAAGTSANFRRLFARTT